MGNGRNTQQCVVGDDEEHGVEDHEDDRAEASRTITLRWNPGDARQHREEAEQRREKCRDAGTDAHGDAERHRGDDANQCAEPYAQQACADVLEQGAVLDGSDRRVADGAHRWENARIDMEQRHDDRPDDHQHEQRRYEHGGAHEGIDPARDPSWPRLLAGHDQHGVSLRRRLLPVVYRFLRAACAASIDRGVSANGAITR
jgi:hypothetical protein